MEFKRFYVFYTDATQELFNTHLPIQLDATCNGFHYLALLSNEDTLFRELNLVSKPKPKGADADTSTIQPHDFYNFLLLKLIKLFEVKLYSSKLDDS